MPLDLLKIEADEAERIAYAEGFTMAAELFARILRAVADRIESGDTFDTFRNMHDINGNIVGTFALKTEQ